MKRYILLYSLAVLTGLSTGCHRDNYPPPNGGVYGTLYDANTNAVIPGATGASSFAQLQLYQIGYSSIPAQPIGIDGGFKADGTYADAQIFNGQYKIMVHGPFFYMDTTTVNIKGNTLANIKVVPYINVKISIGPVTDSTITVTVNALRNTYADAISPQQIVNVGALLGTTMGLNINNYLVLTYLGNSHTKDYSPFVNTSSSTNAEIGTINYTFTFANLTPGTTYYVRGAANVSAGNPNNYYNYSSIVQVTTKQN